MESIAFYSYKGGVGRSLLLVKSARFLASLGKKVVALDLDLESPDLHYKLGANEWMASAETVGAVPFLLALAAGREPPAVLQAFDVALTDDARGSIRLVPAGRAPASEYWRDLARLDELLDFSDPAGSGIATLLELKARIEDELQPDFLLIDTRSGVTEVGGVATTLLADAVVCLTPPFAESLEGTKAVVEGIRAAPRLAGQRPILIFEARDDAEAIGSFPELFLAAGDFKDTAKKPIQDRKEP